jgi:hypothetical protein
VNRSSLRTAATVGEEYGDYFPGFVGATPDLSRVYFQTPQPLRSDDTDGGQTDVYDSTSEPLGT